MEMFSSASQNTVRKESFSDCVFELPPRESLPLHAQTDDTRRYGKEDYTNDRPIHFVARIVIPTFLFLQGQLTALRKVAFHS